MKRILTTVALAATIAAGGSWVLNPTAQPPLGAAGAQEATVTDMTLGEADAPVEIIEYGSFTCPHCATFEQEVFPQIKENYIDTAR